MAKKEKYFYNPQTLQYERVRRTLTNILVRVFFFIGSVSVFAGITVFIAFSFFDSPKTKRLQREIEQLTLNYSILEERMAIVDAVVTELEDRDDNLYREIFEAEPISKDVRNMGFGGAQRFEELDDIAKGNLIKSVYENMERLERQLYVQSKSFDEIAKLAESQQEMLASIPAITPVKLTKTSIASGFGTRIDPIYKTPKFHYGIDFSGQNNTPIYATGNGKVTGYQKIYKRLRKSNCHKTWLWLRD
jgi:murein DD-endopeptidase MepM/ murein hydrolase activator NlpD